MPSSEAIQELFTLEEIERAEEQYLHIYGHAPFSLSSWNPSSYYRNTYLLNKIVLPPRMEFIDYIYSYELDPHLSTACIKRLTDAENLKLTITNSGTASIALVTSVLSALGLRRILVISPTYFAVLYNCRQKGLEVRELYMLRGKNGYQLPKEDILQALSEIDVLWLTNPIYNTSNYLNPEDQGFLMEYILPSAYVVVDECFCVGGRELLRKISDHPHLISIYDPMKQFLINGAKFSAVVFHPELTDLFNQWSDIVCGGLSISTIQAVEFYLSKEADCLCKRLRAADNTIRENVKMTISQYMDASIDNGVDGHMMMCYIPKLPASYLNTFEDFWEFQCKTGVSIIPGIRFHFPNQSGFTFRINLSRYEPARFTRALRRVLGYLSGV